MPEKRSIYTEVVMEVAEKIKRLQEEARASKAIPFMEEKVSGAEFRTRFAQMGTEERQHVIAQLGIDNVMKRLGRGRDA